MIRRLYRDSSIYAAAGIFSQGVAFLLFPFLAHRLRPTDYGVIDIIGLLTTIALLTVALEINQGLGRFVGVDRDEANRTQYASTALIFSIASYGALFVVGQLAARPFTDVLLGRSVNVWVMRIALTGIWVGGSLYLMQDQLRWRHRPAAFAAISAVVAVATTASTAIFVFALNGRAVGVVAGQLVGATAGLIAVTLLSRRAYQAGFDRQKAQAMLRFSLPLVPSSVGVFFNGYADRLAIQHQRSLAEVGVYGVGSRIVVVITLLLLGVQGALTPLVLERHEAPETPQEIAHAFRQFWCVGCIAFVALSVLAEPIVRLLSAPAYYGAAHVVPLLVPSIFFAGLYVFAPGPTIAGRTAVYALVNVLAGGINVVLAFALVPSIGIVGAGIAAATSSGVSFAATLVVSQRLYRVPHDWIRLLAGGGCAVIVVIITRNLLVATRADSLSFENVAPRLLLIALGAIVLLAVTLRPDELTRLIRTAFARPARGAWRRFSLR